MPSSAYPSRHQYDFLKKLRDHVHGVPIEDWPNPATLKRWMRRRGFRRAFKRLTSTFRRDADYLAANTATRAAHGLYRVLAKIDAEPDGIDQMAAYEKTIQQFLRILRMDQQRQRDVRMTGLAFTRTPMYKARLEHRRSDAFDEQFQTKIRARVAENLLNDLRRYHELSEPFTKHPLMSTEQAEHLQRNCEMERRQLRERLLREGLLPSGDAQGKEKTAKEVAR